MNKKLDKRIKKVLVFDTETAPFYEKVEPYKVTGSTEEPQYNVIPGSKQSYQRNGKTYWSYQTNKKCRQIVFDFGYTIADKKGDILVSRNYLIEEVFTNMEVMSHAHYFQKYPQYLRMLSEGKIKMLPWREVIFQLERDMEDYNIQEVYAYNIAFDLQALKDTNRICSKRPFLLWEMLGIKTNCLWGMACETLLQQKTFKRIALEQGWTTPSGNIATSAEVAYRYLTGIYEFAESHTALDDAIIETAIMAKCFRTHKKMSFGIIKQPWRLVNCRESAE